jgi:outer membrane protein assembly factor BamD
MFDWLGVRPVRRKTITGVIMYRRHHPFVLATLVLTLACLLAAGCSFKRKKYENPITKDTQQPDKVLFDKAVADLEHNRFEIARLTLQTLMNTYDTSEYLAKAKLAYADSWYREGGTHGLAQAEAEYKDFILFYPTMEESAEAQERVCMIHFRQMDKPDRDINQAIRAEDECRNLLVQFPNSKYAPEAQQRLREIQEVIAAGEYDKGFFYSKKGSYPAAASRFQGVADQYPLYSGADRANWYLGESYSHMGTRFRQKAGDAYARIVKDYPLSALADDAKKKLKAMELPVPEADPVAYARMKYEQENRRKKGMVAGATGMLKHGPDVTMAAKSGTPAMTSLRPNVPASVPVPQAPAGGTPELTITQVPDSKELDSKPDARLGNQGAAAAAASAAGAPAATETPVAGTAGATDTAAKPAADAQVPLPTNHQALPQKKKKKSKKTPALATPAPVATPAPAAAAPATTPPATTTPPQQ